MSDPGQDRGRAWPGVDGAIVLSSAVLVVAAALIRHADVWSWIAVVLVIDAAYLATTAFARLRRR